MPASRERPSVVTHVERASQNLIAAIGGFYADFKTASEDEAGQTAQIEDEKCRLEGITSLLIQAGFLERLTPIDQYEIYQRLLIALDTLHHYASESERHLNRATDEDECLTSLEDFGALIGRMKLDDGRSGTLAADQARGQPAQTHPPTRTFKQRLVSSLNKPRRRELVDLLKEVGDGLEKRLCWTVVPLLIGESKLHPVSFVLPTIPRCLLLLIQHTQLAGIHASNLEDVELHPPHPVADYGETSTRHVPPIWGTSGTSRVLIELQSSNDRYCGLEKELSDFFTDLMKTPTFLLTPSQRDRIYSRANLASQGNVELLKREVVDYTKLQSAGYWSTKKDLEGLARALREANKSPLFSQHLLYCLGVYAIPQTTLFGLAFRPPYQDCVCSRLVDNLKGASMNDKLKVAAALAWTMYGLHTVDLFHKNFNSHNVLFFHRQGEHLVDTLDWGKPFIVGFNRSRLISGPLTSLRVPKGRKKEWETFYRHPSKIRAEKTGRALLNELGAEVEGHVERMEGLEKLPPFTRRHDLYSLGVVLLEVGLAVPAPELDKGFSGGGFGHRADYTAWDRMNGFAEAASKRLRAKMGRLYHEAVLACLTASGDLCNDQEGELGYLTAFREEICVKLSSIVV